MSKNKMPPELLAHFKKKKKRKRVRVKKTTDKEKRKDALKKARSRMEKKDKKIDLIRYNTFKETAEKKCQAVVLINSR